MIGKCYSKPSWSENPDPDVLFCKKTLAHHSEYAMTRAQIAEAIEVQIAIAQMMPANFGRLSIDAIAILWDLYQNSDPSNLPMGGKVYP
jgi:hypothetical protein